MPERCFERGIVATGIFPEIMQDINKMEKVLGIIADTGYYEWVEFYFEGSKKDLVHIGNVAKSRNLRVVFLAAYPMKTKRWNIGDLDDENRQLYMSNVKKLIDDAYLCKAEKMLILSGPVYKRSEDNIKSLELLKDSIKELCGYACQRADQYILEINLEFFNDVGEPFLLAGPVEMAKEISQEVAKDFSNFGLTFDTSHVVQLKSDLIESFKCIESHVRHIHYANCVTSDSKSPFFGDRHPPLDLPQGDISMDELASFTSFLEERAIVKGKGVKCLPLSVEVIKPSGVNALELFKKTTDCFKACL